MADPTRIDGRARSADRAAERFGEVPQDRRERIGAAHAAAADDDDRGLLDAQFRRRFVDVFARPHRVRLGRERLSDRRRLAVGAAPSLAANTFGRTADDAVVCVLERAGRDRQATELRRNAA